MIPDYEMLFKIAPITISLFALTVSAISLGWNIYRDVILKPRLKISFTLSEVYHDTFHQSITTLILSATNHGPGLINCSMIQLKYVSLWRRCCLVKKYTVMIHDYENSLSGQIPSKLDVGESLRLWIRWEKDCFLKDKYTHIGLTDSFGRTHWASASDVRQARKEYKKEFHE